MNNSSNNDDDFLSLLSTQRRLLERINMERHMQQQRQQCPPDAAAPIARGDCPNAVQENRSTPGMPINFADPLSLTNTPAATHSDADLQMSRLTRDEGNTPTNYFPSSFQHPHQYFYREHVSRIKDFREHPTKSKTHVDSTDTVHDRSTRNVLASMSSDGGVHQRQLSMLSSLSGVIEGVLGRGTSTDFELEYSNTTSPTGAEDDAEPYPILQTAAMPASPRRRTLIRMNPSLPSSVVRENLANFVEAMDYSIRSQQDIHAWDRKMGLKRSHSKTMRLTMRSRKKLRQFLKKDINVLAKHPIRKEKGDADDE